MAIGEESAAIRKKNSSLFNIAKKITQINSFQFRFFRNILHLNSSLIYLHFSAKMCFFCENIKLICFLYEIFVGFLQFVHVAPQADKNAVLLYFGQF